ncbi:MAG TPA: hypothetical protein VHV51_17905 [Polyangiaceae bacterium]|jgi:hypothetical protein|nr:hypothetical protein [Polyangiaceae bacterium]
MAPTTTDPTPGEGAHCSTRVFRARAKDGISATAALHWTFVVARRSSSMDSIAP